MVDGTEFLKPRLLQYRPYGSWVEIPRVSRDCDFSIFCGVDVLIIGTFDVFQFLETSHPYPLVIILCA